MPTNLPPHDTWPATIRMLLSLAVTVPLRLLAHAISPAPARPGRRRAIFARQRLYAVLALLSVAKRAGKWGDPDR